MKTYFSTCPNNPTTCCIRRNPTKGIERWWGDRNHPRLVEIKRNLRELVLRVKEVFWEDITASRVKREIQMAASQYLKEAEKPIIDLFAFYRDKVPVRVYRKFVQANIDYDPEQKTIYVSGLDSDVGHLIGKGGAKVKQFTEQTGYKVVFVDDAQAQHD